MDDESIEGINGANVDTVDPPRLYIYLTDKKISTSWEKPELTSKTKIMYSRRVDDGISDLEGLEFKTIRKIIADGDELVVDVTNPHADLRFRKKPQSEAK